MPFGIQRTAGLFASKVVRESRLIHMPATPSATQLRNARKRRAKQKLSQSKKIPVVECRAEFKADSRPSKRARTDEEAQDPSLEYLEHPLRAPVVSRARSYFLSLGLPNFPVHLGPSTGWRTHAKLAVQADPSGAGVLIGLFQPRSTQVVEVPECPVHHPSINLAVKAVKRACSRLQVRGCCLEKTEGDLRYIILSVNQAGAVQLSLVWNSDSVAEPPPLLSRLQKRLLKRGQGPKAKFPLHSLWVHYNAVQLHSSAIFSRKENSWKLLSGPQTLTFQLPLDCYPVTLHFTPNVFQQANISAFVHIIAAVRERVKEFVLQNGGGTLPALAELYSGVGTIGAHLVDLVSHLSCSDENPHNLACFQLMQASLPASVKSRISYSSRAASKVAMAGDLRSAPLCIVDPPRKGLDSEVVTALIRPGQPKRLLYISCGFNALQKDLAQLLHVGWRLTHAEGFLLFPGSDHIETLVVLDRD